MHLQPLQNRHGLLIGRRAPETVPAATGGFSVNFCKLFEGRLGLLEAVWHLLVVAIELGTSGLVDFRRTFVWDWDCFVI